MFHFITTNHVVSVREHICYTKTSFKHDHEALHVQQKWLHIPHRHVVWCTLHSMLAEMELHKSVLNIPIIHLGDKTILATESKAVSKKSFC